MIGLRDVTASRQSNPVQSRNSSIIATVRDHHHVTHDHRRCDRGPQLVGIRIEIAARPRDLPVGRVVNGQMLSSPNQDRLLPLVLNDQRRCVAVIAFGRRRVIASDLPGHFAGFFVKCGQPRFALMHPCHDDVPIGQHGRSAMIPK